MISAAIAVVLAAAPAAKPGFWEWMAKNEARLADATAKDPVQVMNELTAQLQKHEEDLIVELALGDTPPGLVISADGNSSQFEAVRRVAAAAPKLKRWKVIAFRPRRPLDGQLELEDGVKLSLKDFTFKELGRAAGKVDVEIAVKGRNGANAKEIDNAAYLVLDTVLGEYDAETKIGVIDFIDAPKKSHRPLSELAAVVDEL